jgi:hypothetical protein
VQQKSVPEKIEESSKTVDKEKLTEVEEYKEHAEKIFQDEKELLEIEKINEEIEEDLKNAFLNESVAITNSSLANHYKLYRDRDETFECKISVEGTSLNNSSVRLILESDSWNLLFFGKIYKDGRCIVPLKKMAVLPEGTIGKARLEIIIDEMIFVPWEESFVVEGSKKVKVEILPQKISVNLKDND